MGISNGFMHDIALIEVYEPLSGPTIAVIPLSEGETPQNAYGTVSGWGCIFESPNFTARPEILQAATIPIHSKQACDMYSQIYREQHGINHPDRGQICAGNQMTTACHGDSGGPLVYQGAQIGIVSNGAKYCGTLPVFCTEISQYVFWIRSNIR